MLRAARQPATPPPGAATAVTTALGLGSLIWDKGDCSKVQRPLAAVVVSGVATFTHLTLLVLSVLQQRFGGATAEPGKAEIATGNER